LERGVPGLKSFFFPLYDNRVICRLEDEVATRLEVVAGAAMIVKALETARFPTNKAKNRQDFMAIGFEINTVDG
jgi:hypothetical protein